MGWGGGGGAESRAGWQRRQCCQHVHECAPCTPSATPVHLPGALPQLVDKSNDLSMASQLFYKQARKANSCCKFM